MRHVDTALRLVFRGHGYVVAAVVTTLIMGAFYAWAGQLVTFYLDGSVYVDPDPAHLAALAALALLTGLVLPVQVFAARRGAWGVRQAGTGVMGLVAGIGSLTCCSPLLIPAVLALVGFSGTTPRSRSRARPSCCSPLHSRCAISRGPARSPIDARRLRDAPRTTTTGALTTHRSHRTPPGYRTG